MSAEDQRPLTALGSLIVGIDHVGVAVRDLDASISFYVDTFGLQLRHRETNEEQGVAEAMLGIGDTLSELQLLAPLTPDSPIGRFIDRSGEGIQQMAYRVTDVDAAAERLRAAGLRLLYDHPRRGTAGARINFVHPKDCGGVLVELIERNPDSVY
jgi:methylmalonyl-CoA/ethylmalonyl-CoA epimerase